ncbi:MAG: hypothetical protein OXC68_09110 [Aestuariivita sp.]|nr:hypothetical protein [Aestuariivita sp.]
MTRDMEGFSCRVKTRKRAAHLFVVDLDANVATIRPILPLFLCVRLGYSANQKRSDPLT